LGIGIRLCGLALLAACLGACRAAPDSAALEVGAPGDPGAPIQAYFDALSRGDCPQLQASIGGAAQASILAIGCAEAFEEFADHPTQLLNVESVARDGRDPSLRLVRARIRAGEGERVVVIGVQAIEGSWRVVRI
jgi:hypothetical protein